MAGADDFAKVYPKEKYIVVKHLQATGHITGKFLVSAFAMLLLVFMTGFAKASLATDLVRPSEKPKTWNIGGFISVSVALGFAMLAETLLLVWIGWSRFGLATNKSNPSHLQLSLADLFCPILRCIRP